MIMNRLSPLAFAAAMVATSLSVLASSPSQAATVHAHHGDAGLSVANARAELHGPMLGRNVQPASR